MPSLLSFVKLEHGSTIPLPGGGIRPVLQTIKKVPPYGHIQNYVELKRKFKNIRGTLLICGNFHQNLESAGRIRAKVGKPQKLYSSVFTLFIPLALIPQIKSVVKSRYSMEIHLTLR